jgi:hypothetical protein
MSTKLNGAIWRVVLMGTTLAFWVSLAAAQEEVTLTEEAPNFGLIWAILLAGLLAVVVLGFLMNSRNSSNSDDHN